MLTRAIMRMPTSPSPPILPSPVSVPITVPGLLLLKLLLLLLLSGEVNIFFNSSLNQLQWDLRSPLCSRSLSPATPTSMWRTRRRRSRYAIVVLVLVRCPTPMIFPIAIRRVSTPETMPRVDGRTRSFRSRCCCSSRTAGRRRYAVQVDLHLYRVCMTFSW